VNRLKSLKTLLTALTLFASINLHGAYNGCEPTCEPDDCCQSLCGRFSVDAEFLYWRASNSDNQYGTVGTSTEVGTRTAGTTETVTFDLEGKELKSKWSPAFRIGVGYEFNDSKWDTQLIWTDFCSRSAHSQETVTSPENFLASDLSPILPLFFPVTTALDNLEIPTYSGTIDASWKTHLNVVDWQLGRSIDCGRCFTFRPHVDVRYASIKQHIHQDASIAVASIVDLDDERTLTGNSETNVKRNFYGVGPMVGLDLNWNWNCNWSVYGKSAFGLLLGQNHIKSSVTSTAILTSSSTDVISPFTETLSFEESQRKKHTMRAAISLGAGIEWKTTFLCDDYPLTVFAGWEQHTYVNSRVQDNFYGVNVGANVQF